MVQKYFVDTLIYRDYYENRSDNLRPLGEWALEFFRSVAKQKGVILYCDLVIEEMAIEYNSDIIVLILETIASIAPLIKIEATAQEESEAKKLKKERKLPFADALYAVIARDNDAILVSRDNHFSLLLDIAVIRKPEELI
ncbi:MAG: PIN domain-containing protein [Nanoarchaeota archaeon]|nr:PIN domain-containing protein [Nanoarchaeota archaeon]